MKGWPSHLIFVCGCNVERPAYGQWPALSGEYLSGTERRARAQSLATPPQLGLEALAPCVRASACWSPTWVRGTDPPGAGREFVVAFAGSLPPRRGPRSRGHARIPASTQVSRLHPIQFNVKRGPGRSSGWGLSGLDPVSFLGSPFENLRATSGQRPETRGRTSANRSPWAILPVPQFYKASGSNS